ncbi:DNA repair protein rhp54 [Hordeum vulgare]|nr:DNA repair protein rhp54 [Hordeum vulgare]
MVMLESPHASATQLIPGFHVYPQASLLFGECSPEVSVVTPFMPSPAPIDLNATPVAGGSSSDGPRKRAREMSADMISGVRNLFDKMPVTVNDERANRFMQSIIFEGDAAAAGGAITTGMIPKRPKVRTAEGRSRRRPMIKLACRPPSCKIR